LINVIKSLLDDFELKPYLCKLLNIEFGLNLEPFGDINKLLDGLVEHKGKKFDSSSNNKLRIESKWNDLRTMEKVDVSNSPFNYRVNL
jgi:hypothetical protein